MIYENFDFTRLSPGGAGGPGGQNEIWSEYGHVAHQNDRLDKGIHMLPFLGL